MAYERERTRISAATVARAKALVAKRAFTGRCLDIVDDATPGLVLRVGPQGARWLLKTRLKTVTLGAESTAWCPAPVDRRARRRADGPWIVEDLIDEFVTWKTVNRSGVPAPIGVGSRT